ncbi:carbohydrate sulfotransferase 1-like isoform X2 [Bombina bombina]|uniref:carbohydrate sulfotransferase 1-like isoform X2 n=1 Tax=Bombina bombina TaxID=8345 RepID=UPI00235AFF46|nr:carbohydrate sulfotransferase 1-like isoform X2 [Bombina bombina]
MECSWKAVLVLVFASLGIQYTAIKSLRTAFNAPCQEMGLCRTHQGKENDWRLWNLCEDSRSLAAMSGASSRKHIIIFATTRSGSSFLGQLFNQNPDIFYLYEPLYHVQQAFTNSSARIQNQIDRRSLLGAYRDLLRNLFDCDFYFLENYIRPPPKDHLAITFFRRGASNALCLPPLCENLQSLDEHLCAKKCRTVNLTLASKSCHTYRHMAIKTVRIPEINDIRTLVEDPRLNLKIIHLARDPRGILASRISTFIDQYRAWKIWNSSGRKPHNVDLSQITTTCTDLSKSVDTGLSKPSWLKGKYMLVRYEDIAKDPIKKAKEIYQFVGLEWKGAVHKWLLQNTNGTVASFGNFKYTTSRNSAETAEHWRLHLCYDIVHALQDLCNITLSQLGYQVVNSVWQLKNISHSLVEPRIFLPFT